MAPHNEEDDPAIYRSGTHKKSKAPGAEQAESSTSAVAGRSHEPAGADASADESGTEHMDEDDEEEEDSTLLAVQPGFNRLLLVLRDERVMRFVKYVSAAAEGSRWDVCGEYEVGMMQEADGSESE